mgnify:CR=1 FL=1
MKIIITGGAGFIGSHLAEDLIKKKNIKKIVIIDDFKDGSRKNIKNFEKNKKIKVYKIDINKIKKTDPIFKNCKFIFHLAALADIVPSIVDPFDYCKTNIMGTINILEAARYNKINKIIYSASSSCYGIPKKYPTYEDGKIDPKYPYAFSKYIGEQAIIHWSNVYKINFVSLRLFNVYGTRSRTSGTYGAMFGVFLAQKLHGKPFTIVGNGRQTRDFTYVTDVIDAFLKAAESKIVNEIFNIGSGETVSINKIIKLLGGKKVFIKKRPGEPDCTFANISKVKKLIKWKPKIKIEKGIEYLLKDINYWKKAPIWTPKKINKATKLWFKYIS